MQGFLFVVLFYTKLRYPLPLMPLMNVKYFIYLLSACLLFFLLCNPLQLYFLSDDFDSMYMAQTWSGVIHSYRPGSDFLLHTDHLLYGYNASGYHITNYLLHFSATFLLFFTTQQLLLPFYNNAAVEKYAFTASIIFLFYPFHSECIFWLVGRSSLLAVLFAMASIYFYLKKRENSGWYVLSLLCLLLGLFSYESIWTLPAIITIISFVYNKKVILKNKLFYISGYWLTFFIYLAARLYLTATVIGSPYGTQKIVSFDIPFLARNLASLISRSFVPPMQSAVVFVIWLGIIAIVLVVVVFTIRKHITTPHLVIAAAYLLCLLPVISLGIDTHDTESERFLYMPSAFLAMLFSVVVFILFKNKAAYAFGVLLAVQIIFLVLSYRSFAAASKVTKASVQAIQSLYLVDSIYCIDLPGQYKGGFIFRNGITNAANLFAPVIKKVTILSQKELLNYPEHYYLHTFSITELPAHIPNSSELLETDTDVLKPPRKTAVFVWTDTSLNVYK